MMCLSNLSNPTLRGSRQQILEAYSDATRVDALWGAKIKGELVPRRDIQPVAGQKKQSPTRINALGAENYIWLCPSSLKFAPHSKVLPVELPPLGEAPACEEGQVAAACSCASTRSLEMWVFQQPLHAGKWRRS